MIMMSMLHRVLVANKFVHLVQIRLMLDLSQICSKNLPIMLFILPIMLVFFFNMNNIDVRILLLEFSIRVFTIRAYVCFIEYKCILNVLLEYIEYCIICFYMS